MKKTIDDDDDNDNDGYEGNTRQNTSLHVTAMHLKFYFKSNLFIKLI